MKVDDARELIFDVLLNDDDIINKFIIIVPAENINKLEFHNNEGIHLFTMVFEKVTSSNFFLYLKRESDDALLFTINFKVNADQQLELDED